MVKLNGSNLKEYNKSFLGKGKRFIRDSRNFFRTVNEKHRILLRLSVNSNNDQFNEIYNLNKKLIKLGNRLVNDEKALFFLAKYIFEELGYGIRETRRRDLKQQEQFGGNTNFEKAKYDVKCPGKIASHAIVSMHHIDEDLLEKDVMGIGKLNKYLKDLKKSIEDYLIFLGKVSYPLNYKEDIDKLKILVINFRNCMGKIIIISKNIHDLVTKGLSNKDIHKKYFSQSGRDWIIKQMFNRLKFLFDGVSAYEYAYFFFNIVLYPYPEFDYGGAEDAWNLYRNHVLTLINDDIEHGVFGLVELSESGLNLQIYSHRHVNAMTLINKIKRNDMNGINKVGDPKEFKIQSKNELINKIDEMIKYYEKKTPSFTSSKIYSKFVIPKNKFNSFDFRRKLQQTFGIITSIRSEYDDNTLTMVQGKKNSDKLTNVTSERLAKLVTLANVVGEGETIKQKYENLLKSGKLDSYISVMNGLNVGILLSDISSIGDDAFILLPVFLPGLSMSIGISKFGLNGDEYIIIIARYPVIGGRKVKDKFDGIF
jgi:hypothetical protein